MNYVVGSGPSGIACAKALLDRGLPVTVLDAGVDLEDDKARHRNALAATTPDRWPSDSLAAVKAGMTASPSGVPLKRVFGSDFPFREPEQATPLRQEHAHALRSFARGGLSRAWGATLLPASADDVRAWPVSLAELTPHYKAVMKWVPLSAAADGLDALFPTYCDEPGDLRPSRQALGLLSRLAASHEALTRLGVTFGRARLAVHARPRDSQAGCVHCRLCLYGCPYGCIFSADQFLGELMRHPNFSYRDGILVRRVEETASEARLEAIDLATGKTLRFLGQRVFLACGVLTTSQLLMDALGVNEVRIQTSQSFLMPLMNRKADKRVRMDDGHALAQIYLLMEDPSLAERLIQLQIYTYSDLVSEALEHSFAGPVFRVLPALKHAVEDRLVVLQGLLPSEESDSLTMRRAGEEFTVRGSLSARTIETVRRVARATRAIGSLGGFHPLTPLLRIGEPGQSFHSGASFPMSAAPGPADSDRLGRPGGLTRVHAVDATVLPDIPAPPLTLTVMANAHRIGTHAG